MFTYEAEVRYPNPDWPVVDREARKAGDDIALHLEVQLKLALIRAKAIATAKTLNSIKADRSSGAESTRFFRKIVMSEVWKFIYFGRRAGAKMPPEKAMEEWFRALNIPKKAWFPIRLSIARRGIRPRKFIDVALRNAAPYVRDRSRLAGRNIADNLFGRPIPR